MKSIKLILLKLLARHVDFLSHILKLGLIDGWKLYNLKDRSRKHTILTLRDVKHPIIIRGSGSDLSVFKQVFYVKHYEIKLPSAPSVIIDCGANIGLATIYFKNRYPSAMIIAVEPEQDNFDLLAANTKPYSNIFLEKKGIWSEPAKLKIVEGPDKQPWSFHLEPTLDPLADNVIEAIGIDSIIEKHNLEFIDLLKVDIEGAESELFEKNYERWLPKVKVIIIELHDWLRPLSSKNFLKVLSRYNFSISYSGENIIATQILSEAH